MLALWSYSSARWRPTTAGSAPAYNIGDVEHMTTDALIDAAAGKNVFIEPRLVRPSKFANERGGFGDTMAVFALVGDSDSDTNKPFTAKLPASALIETSPNNEHRWFFLRRAIGVGDAVELGKLMRESWGGDHCRAIRCSRIGSVAR